ncbi:DEAD/DEAH box helicase [Spirochaetota bacterium]
MNFNELNLDSNLLKGIEEAGYAECMPVQEMTFPLAFEKKDIYVQSQTGSGKSAAFLVSIFHLFLQKKPEERKKALIIAPTRELAVQISKEAKLLAKYIDLKVGVFYGGVGYNQQEKDLRDGVDVMVGTPGRVIDFSESGKIDLSQIEMFILDEADRLLDMGFLPDIRRLLRKMPMYPNRHTMLFSATLDFRVKHIADDYMHEPEEIEINPDQVTVENISQIVYHVGQSEKMNLLVGILNDKMPKNTLIFTNTKRMAERVSDVLKANGFKCAYITGDLPQNKRQRAIEDFKKDKVSILIATDVAARGIHIDDLELVVNYDLPENPENYVHRIGRTARVGKSGTAISLTCEKFVYGLEAIEAYIEYKIPVSWAEENLFAQLKRPAHRRKAGEGRDRGKLNSRI